LAHTLFREVISSYMDEQALEDGTLVALAGPARDQSVTRTVFDHFAQQMGAGVTNISPLLRAIEYTLDVAVGGFTLMFPEDY
jgi:hypothetical protein